MVNNSKTTLSYKLKVINQKECVEQLRELSRQYREMFNVLSSEVVGNITTMTIGKLRRHIEPILKEGKYEKYKSIVMYPENKDMPLYKLFMEDSLFMYDTCIEEKNVKETDTVIGEKFIKDGKDRSNIVFECFTRPLLIESGKYGVPFMTDSTLYRFGVTNAVVSSLESYFSQFSPRIKKAAITEASETSTIMDQLVLENDAIMKRHKGDRITDAWENEIEYLEERYPSPAKLDRVKTLYKALGNVGEEELNSHKTMILLEQIQTRFSKIEKNSSTITFNKIPQLKAKIRQRVGEDGIATPNIDIELSSKKDSVVLKTGGHRKLFGEDASQLIDLSGVSYSLTIQFKGNDIYAILVFNRDVPDNPIGENPKGEGIDINVKHMMIVTSIPADKLKFPNIMERLLSDKDASEALRKRYGKEVTDSLSELAKNATFGYLGADFIYDATRRTFGDDQKASKAIDALLGKMIAEETDEAAKHYLGANLKMRRLLANHYRWKRVYADKKGEYQKGWTEDDFRSRGDEFENTEEGARLTGKMEEILEHVKGCRNDIIHYVYKLVENHTDTELLGFEYLTSSQFEKRQVCASPNSLLHGDKHNFFGKPLSDLEKSDAYAKKKDYYNVYTDDEGNVKDITMTEYGLRKNDESLFFNGLIKAISFASIKDEFSKLASFRKLKTAYAPAMYTSQMNSKTHKMYTYIDEKDGKEKIAKKNQVRKGQERHVNGMNADVNASLNIKHAVTEPTKMFVGTAKWKYGKPIRVPSIRSQANFLLEIRERNMTEPLHFDNGGNTVSEAINIRKSLKQS